MTVLLSCLSRFAGVSQCGTGETVRDTYSNRVKRCRTCVVSVSWWITHPCPSQEGSHYTVPACLALSRVACLQKPWQPWQC